MMKNVSAVCVALAALCAPSVANAQMLEWKDRGFLNVSAGVKTGAKQVATTLAFPLYDETASIETTREVADGFLWDATAGYRVWKNLAVGVSVSGRSANGDGATVASIPNPVFYDQPRTVSGAISGMKHRELWGSLLAVWVFPVTEQLEIMAMAGPTVVRVEHEVAGGVTVAEATTPVVTVALDTVSKSVWGVTAGIDGRYMITKRFGLGAFARYSGAKVNLNSTTKLDVGGLQMGAGLRVRF
jgi:Outer membrane protein beta-barrel domain